MKPLIEKETESETPYSITWEKVDIEDMTQSDSEGCEHCEEEVDTSNASEVYYLNVDGKEVLKLEAKQMPSFQPQPIKH